MKEEMKFCQSCGMPLGETDQMLGTEKDGSKSSLYCKYCYENGSFTVDCTMEEMIDFCTGPMTEHNPEMTRKEAKERMEAFFPYLERWRKN